MVNVCKAELESFLEEWQEGPERNKEIFLQYKEQMERDENIQLEFLPRPGITYSLRIAHKEQKARPLIAMIDVIEDAPRWLSVCFYNDMITDPEEQGDAVPGGLLGEDAVCFDLEAWDDERVRYVASRLDEACQHAAQEGQ
ncbi:MAG: hypothetical protein Q3M24_13340 [Candidatus Electrothrix aestuarii]|uniref:DUF5655 domain-containing protein n=1 Tax=Candidatus Electrothrix aestuarii TaxID=3062594 RepID=A0AAU8LP80_9BACT|nr:hypothetical protein [Candidatus Electrothrix aestuarii]